MSIVTSDKSKYLYSDNIIIHNIESELISDRNDFSITNITPLIYELDGDDDYLYTIVSHGTFIRIFRKKNNRGELLPTLAQIILDIDSGNLVYNTEIPVVVLNKILEFLTDANTKVDGVDVCDYLSSTGIFY